MIIGSPAGIGDWSWLWSKLIHVIDEIDGFAIVDGWPHRTVPYVQLASPHPSDSWAYYEPSINYQQILRFEQMAGIGGEQPPIGITWKEVMSKCGGNRMILLQPNRHLELGRRLEDWLPDLPTNFHYPLYTSNADKHRAFTLLRDAGGKVGAPMVGISCASYRGSEAWRTWGRNEWVDCLGRMIHEGWQPVIMGGFWDDLSHAVASTLHLPDIVGKTSVAEMVEVLRILPAYVGFSSGMNVIRTVLSRPAFALWPDFQAELSTSWAPPDMLIEGTYQASLWRSVDEVWPRIRDFLGLCK